MRDPLRSAKNALPRTSSHRRAHLYTYVYTRGYATLVALMRKRVYTCSTGNKRCSTCESHSVSENHANSALSQSFKYRLCSSSKHQCSAVDSTRLTARTHIASMRYLTSGLVVLALGLALVQAAPKKIEKKSISDAGAPKAIEQVSQNLDAPAKLGDEALLEATDGQNVERAKKQATTFCVEVRPNKPTQVDCSELNNNQPQRPPLQPQPEPEPQPQPDNYRPPEIKIDFLKPSVPMGPPCEPEIAGFIAPGGDVVYAPTGNCAHNIPSSSQTPYNGPSSMMPSGPGGHVHLLHIPGGFPHSGFPGNYPSTGLPGGYPPGMIPNSGAGFPNIQISTGPSGPGGFAMNGLPNGGTGVPSINVIPGGGFPSGMPSNGLPYGGAGVPTMNIVPGTGLPGGLSNGGYPSAGSPSGGYPSGVSPIHVLHLPGGGFPSGPSAGGSGFPTIYITPGSGTPGASPQGPHLPSLHSGHTQGHHRGPLHLNGVQCTCKSSLGTNLYRSDDGMPSNEQLAAQFLEDLQKNTQHQPGSSVVRFFTHFDETSRSYITE